MSLFYLIILSGTAKFTIIFLRIYCYTYALRSQQATKISVPSCRLRENLKYRRTSDILERAYTMCKLTATP